MCLKTVNIPYKEIDCRQNGRKIAVKFVGELYPEQKSAVNAMLFEEMGILRAATAFGKTVVGAYLIAARKVNTLILVQNIEIMRNWQGDCQKFLHFDEALPTYTTPKGRTRQRKSHIGCRYSGHDALTGIADVAMVSSFGRDDDVDMAVRDYGMVIVDECHHAASVTAQNILRNISARYVYGLTATPKRADGQEKKTFMQFGKILYRYTSKQRAEKQQINHYVIPRFTRLVSPDCETIKINEAYELARNSEARNQQIIDDVTSCLTEGRNPLILTRFKEHAEKLYRLLEGKAQHAFLLMGGKSAREREKLRSKMQAVPKGESAVLVAIGQYVEEGFNYPRLDTLFLLIPIAWKGLVEQYAGRLHRDYEGKKETVIYDYVDAHIRVLEKMYHERLRAYKSIGYKIMVHLPKSSESDKVNAIFDAESYDVPYQHDLKLAKRQVIISSPGLSGRRVDKMLAILKSVQENGVKVFVITLEPECYPDSQKERAEICIEKLRTNGVEVTLRKRMHEHYAIVDDNIVWYGI